MNRDLNGSTFLVTGATGLLGVALIKYLLDHYKDVVVYALIRDPEKANRAFADYQTDRLRFIASDVENLPPKDLRVEYVIHAASQTSSKAFVERPVETIRTAIYGTTAVLEFARTNPVKGMVYLSSMEVYGAPGTDEKIYEDHISNLDILSVRSCYAASKRMCENLCVSYLAEYGVPARILRLTQTFGAGVRYDDGRVFAEFARCAIEGKDIVLRTKGETKRCYLALSDAVTAILKVLVDGEDGNAYNAANESTYCTIYEMAKLVAENCAGQPINVVVDEPQDISKYGYAPVLKMNLSTQKLCGLGWSPVMGLEEMYQEMIDAMKDRNLP